jgi:hypothetical protein
VSTITATPDNAKSQVRLDLDFSDIAAPYVLVQRIDTLTGAPTTVRGHGGTVTVGSVAYAPMYAGFRAVLYDTEMPLDNSFYYVATAPAATVNATPDFSGGYTDPWYSTTPATVAIRPSSSDGQTYLTFQTDGTQATPTIRAEDFPVTAGAQITLVAVASATISQTVNVGLVFRDTAGAVLSSPAASKAVLAATTLTVTFTAPASAVTAQPYISVNGTPVSSTVFSISSIVYATVAGSATSAGVQVASLGSCQFKDPLIPGNNVRVDFAWDPNPQCTPTEGVFWQSLDTEQYAANAAVFNINNQDVAQVVSKRRSSPTSTLTLVSRTFADRDRLINLLASGSPLLFQAPDEYGLPDRYLSVGANSISRVLPDHRIPIRVHSMPHTVCAAPGGPMQGTVGARWADICKTWAAVNSAGYTWQQLLDGAAA